jgi:hypothetical protein
MIWGIDMSLDLEKERSQFEKSVSLDFGHWLMDCALESNFKRDENDPNNYADERLDAAWWAWIKAKQLAYGIISVD